MLDPRVPTFPIAHVVGLAVAAALLWRRLEAAGARAALVTAAMAAGAIAGAYALGLALRVPRALGGEIGLFERGLPMAYGALGGAALATALAARKVGAPVRAALDALAPALGVLVLFGRAGCFFGGCCFGEVSDIAWAVAHPAGTPAHAHHFESGRVALDAGSSLPVHPTALYEAAVGALMLAAGIMLARRLRRGGAFASVALLYAVGRFAVELARGDPRPFAGPLSLPQWLSVLVVAAVWLWAGSAPAFRRRASAGRPPRSPPPRAASRRR
jgi:phosphatidylglycerol:prolipoprotein diacylglycerol transferase